MDVEVRGMVEKLGVGIALMIFPLLTDSGAFNTGLGTPLEWPCW